MEYPQYKDGKRGIEIRLQPKKACSYYWKALITRESSGKYRVRLFDRFGDPYGPEPRTGEESVESPLFDDLDDAKTYARRMLMNQ
jgi:hypothetical protein